MNNEIFKSNLIPINISNNITNSTDNFYYEEENEFKEIFKEKYEEENVEIYEEESEEEYIDVKVEENKLMFIFENFFALGKFGNMDIEIVANNKLIFFCFINSNKCDKEKENENESSFETKFNEVFKNTPKNKDFDNSNEDMNPFINTKIDKRFLQKKKNKIHTREDDDNILSHIKAIFINFFILEILNLIIPYIPNKIKCQKFNNKIIQKGNNEFNFDLFNSKLENLFEIYFEEEKRKYLENCIKNNQRIDLKNYKCKNEDFLKILKTKEKGIRILNYKVIELFNIYLKEDWESIISNIFQIDKKELKKIKDILETKTKDESENYMKKYKEIEQEIAEQSFFNSKYKSTFKIVEFYYPKIHKYLKNYFFTMKKEN